MAERGMGFDVVACLERHLENMEYEDTTARPGPKGNGFGYAKVPEWQLRQVVGRLRAEPPTEAGEQLSRADVEVIRLKNVIAHAAQAIVEDDPDEAYHILYWADGGASRGEHLRPKSPPPSGEPTEDDPFGPMVADMARRAEIDEGLLGAQEPTEPSPGRCPEVSDQGLRCTLDAGHEGDHSALRASVPAPGVEPVAWRCFYVDMHGDEVWAGQAHVTEIQAKEWAHRFANLKPTVVPLFAHPPTDTGAREALAVFAAGVEVGIDFADTHDPDDGHGIPTKAWINARYQRWISRALTPEPPDVEDVLRDGGYEITDVPRPETSHAIACRECGRTTETVSGVCIRCAVKDAPTVTPETPSQGGDDAA